MKIALAFFLALSILSLASRSFANDGLLLKEEKIDLDSDGKLDVVRWLKNDVSDQTPGRVVLIANGQTLLDHKAELCAPDRSWGNPDDCEALTFNGRLSPKKEAMIAIRSSNTMSSVDQTSSTYLYRRQNGVFTLIGATWESHPTGQSRDQEYAQTDVNYSTGKAIVETWTVINEKPKHKKSKTCTLKRARKNDRLSDFSAFAIEDEVKCTRDRT